VSLAEAEGRGQARIAGALKPNIVNEKKNLYGDAPPYYAVTTRSRLMKVLFAIDFSSHSKNAVQLFRRMQLPSGSEVHLIHVNHPEEWPERAEPERSSEQPESLAGIRKKPGSMPKRRCHNWERSFRANPWICICGLWMEIPVKKSSKPLNMIV
jgi:hypothetical protein